MKPRKQTITLIFTDLFQHLMVLFLLTRESWRLEPQHNQIPWAQAQVQLFRKDISLPWLLLQHLSKGSLGLFPSLGLARGIETSSQRRLPQCLPQTCAVFSDPFIRQLTRYSATAWDTSYIGVNELKRNYQPLE